MKKHHLLLLLLMAVPSMMMAQHITRGQVVDRYGNPVSGARVQGRGTTKSATTTIDGSFSLETMQPIRRIEVSAIGKAPTIKRVSKKSDTKVKLNDLHYWNATTSWRYYLGAQCALISKDSKDIPLGLMFGMEKRGWGFYVKAMYSGLPKYDSEYAYYYYYGSNAPNGLSEYAPIEYKTGYFQVGGGFMCRVVGPWHIYVGSGYYERRVTFTASDGTIYKYKRSYENSSYYNYSHSNAFLEFGALFDLRYVTLNVGMNILPDPSITFIHFGIGYLF